MATAAEELFTAYNLGADAQAFVAKPGKMLIGAEWVDAQSGKTLDVIDPASETVLTTVPAGDKNDIDAAVRAARAAFEGPWSSLPPTVRELMLFRVGDLIEKHAEEFAQLDSLDNGKSATVAQQVDVGMAIAFTRYMAGWATKIEGKTIDVSLPFPDVQGFAYTRREPVGVVGAIVPWNFPLIMAVWKIIPALAAGCTVVLKPAEETSLSALRLGELILEAGIPPGVVNIVTGYGEDAGAALASHTGINKIAFTGSTEVGKLIGKSAMENMTRVSLELGGKSPMIVLEDADVDRVVEGLSMGIWFNHGQVCTAGSRLYVQKNKFDAVVEKMASAAGAMKLGPGLDPTTQMGPLVSKKQQERVCGYIESGLAEGATAVTGGGKPEGKGYFVSPTVLTNTREDMKVVQEEIFGPVLVASPFSDEEEAVRLANATRYGLAASIWSNDLSKVQRLIPRIKAGTVWVNTHNILDAALPFGGYKQSGIGREMGRDAVTMYTESKSVLMFV